MAGLANCQAPVEHRGGVALTRNPRDNSYLFPGRPPAEQNPDYYLSLQQGDYDGSVNRINIVNIPPWQNIPWEPIPYPEQDQWQPIPFPEWPLPQFPAQDYTLMVSGPVATGPVETPSVRTDSVYSQNIYTDGDFINLGVAVNHGPRIQHGPVFNNHNVVNQRNVVNNRVVVNGGPVFNNNVVHNAVAHNYATYLHGEVYAGGQRLSLINIDVVTDVEWDGTDLTKKYASLTVLGKSMGDSSAVILTGVSCPPPE